MRPLEVSHKGATTRTPALGFGVWYRVQVWYIGLCALAKHTLIFLADCTDSAPLAHLPDSKL